MERTELEQHQGTLRGLRDTIGTMKQSGSPPPLGDVVDLIEGVAGVVQALIDEKILTGEHENAVSEMIREGNRPRSIKTEPVTGPDPRD